MKTYESYKDSGIEWLGEIPAHWNHVSLRWASRIYAGGTPDKNKSEYWKNGLIPWLNSGVVNQSMIKIPSSHITKIGFNNSSAKWIPEGALVIALAGQGKTKGMVGIVTFRTTCNQSLGVIVPSNKVKNKYLFYWLKRNYFQIRGLAGEGLRDGLNLTMLGDIPVPLPPLPEQQTIATYLEHKTAQIDALIDDKRRLIELYQEERAALINQAVTRGLDPDVPMKDSGIEWLGEIPAHWEVKKLDYLKELGTVITYGIVQAGPNQEKGIPYIRTSDMAGKEFPKSGYLKTTKEIDNSYRRSKVKIGDLVIAIRATLGKGMLVPDYLDGANLTQGTAKVTPGPQLSSQFLYHAFNASYNQISIQSVAKGATFREITLEKLRKLLLAVPPLGEQEDLSIFIDQKTRKIDILISETEQEITLLEEYRTALISEVVTGKVDVRDWEAVDEV